MDGLARGKNKPSPQFLEDVKVVQAYFLGWYVYVWTVWRVARTNRAPNFSRVLKMPV